jgi:hypothetical protein
MTYMNRTTVEFERNGTEFEVEVEFEVDGEDMPATREQPAEYAYAIVYRVWPVNTQTGKPRAKHLHLTSAEEDALCERVMVKVVRDARDNAWSD